MSDKTASIQEPYCGICREPIGLSESHSSLQWDEDPEGNVKTFVDRSWFYCYRAICVQKPADQPPREKYHLSGVGAYLNKELVFELPAESDCVSQLAQQYKSKGPLTKLPLMTNMKYVSWCDEKPSVYPQAYTIHDKCWHYLNGALAADLKHQLPRLLAALRTRCNSRPSSGCGYVKDRLAVIMDTRDFFVDACMRDLNIDGIDNMFSTFLGMYLTKMFFFSNFGPRKHDNANWNRSILQGRNLPNEIHEMIAMHLDFSTLVSYMKALGLRFGDIFWKGRLRKVKQIKDFGPWVFDVDEQNWEQLTVEIERTLAAFNVLKGAVQAVKVFCSGDRMARRVNAVLL
ncbi:hypothetical protein BGW36DRAFT_445369 [Talaromyces proteolyticus]|uniref:Uncharacterized protein n=1 Tax=Talaromyces proteolyticus TaxID=1131652 RepID=A0AAD4KWJ5_9EURO|nr:uncharacterized protein BGW36DRAFT_445369 [Talaromyces proteolyticus]KAH8701754.1 hypothetical protein BGW36DRAFT_445369 [Talaromyces proteolyticus]